MLVVSAGTGTTRPPSSASICLAVSSSRSCRRAAITTVDALAHQFPRDGLADAERAAGDNGAPPAKFEIHNGPFRDRRFT